ncbi:hypothetical protein [Actinopolymorpha pittospori]|uniref:Uncharacterized protein n=1 Tax=Actinopolymorpha pittospori TaxID=648752 RepID=A0A927N7Q0_9ACTN|nr:hypothetical protein [Actinopolymorpha pittospori]MBE1613177.1 hypothetical protein [Actinopolymorpha pittospori]
MDPLSSAEAVKVLLATARLTVSPDEFDRLVGVYPLLRAQADGLYMPELESEDPALSFDPTVAHA